MKIENAVVSYLKDFGNTRENDLISYGVQRFGRSSKDMKKVVDRMVIKGKIFRIVHSKLRPPEVYVSLDEPLPPFEVGVKLGEARVGFEARKILEEAAAVAERRVRDMESGKR